MKLSLAEVEHVADLARLALTAAEKDRFREQLSSILAYAERLQEPDTTGIPPTAAVLPVSPTPPHVHDHPTHHQQNQ